MACQIYGRVVGELLVASPDKGYGVPVELSDAPAAPDGYEATFRFVEDGSAVRQMWSVAPKGGTAEAAVLALAKMQAGSLTDEQALEVPALYDAWSPGNASYAAGTRLTYKGELYKVLSDHKPQASWTPDADHTHYIKVEPSTPGVATTWEQRLPGVKEGYATGDLVVYTDGKTYRSTKDANYDIPSYPGTAWEAV